MGRNRTTREFLNSVTDIINVALQSGIEPLSIKIILNNFCTQLEKLALEFEEKEAEAEAQEKENLKNAVPKDNA